MKGMYICLSAALVCSIDKAMVSITASDGVLRCPEFLFSFLNGTEGFLDARCNNALR